MAAALRLLLLSVPLLAAAPAASDSSWPAPRGAVNDFAGILRPQTVRVLEGLFAELERKTGAEIAVAVLSDLRGLDVESAAVELFETWGIGRKGRDDGVLLLVAPAERKVRLEVGYGLESVIPDGLAGEILRRHALPAFREGDFDSGVLRAGAAVAARIAESAGVTLSGEGIPREAAPKGGGGNLLWNLLLLVLLFSVVLRHPWLLFFLPLGRGYSGGFSRGGFGAGSGGFGGGLSGGGGASGSW